MSLCELCELRIIVSEDSIVKNTTGPIYTTVSFLMAPVVVSSPKMGKENNLDLPPPRPHTPDTSSLASSLGIDGQERRRMIRMIEDVLHKGSKGEFLKMLSYQGIPLIALIITCAILLVQAAQLSSSAKLLESVARRNDHIGELVVSMQIERGLSAAFLSTDTTLLNVFIELQEARHRTDAAFTSIQVSFLRTVVWVV